MRRQQAATELIRVLAGDVAISSMNASVTKPFTELPTERQKPNGMPGSVSVYSTRRFGMAYGRLAAPSTEIASTPFDPASAFGFSCLSSDCWTIRCFQAVGLPAASTAPHMRT